MTDRELLELAAKASGLANPRYHEATGRAYDCGTCILHETHEGRETHSWNPLTDDGDALRLAVKLELTPYVPTKEYKFAGCQNNDASIDVTEPEDGDAYASTRRAIVRAAAEIGKGK